MIDEKYLAELRRTILANRTEGIDSIASDITDPLLDTVEKLWKVARAADGMIYRPRSEYAAGSKKAVLKAALENLYFVPIKPEIVPPEAPIVSPEPPIVSPEPPNVSEPENPND